ncbi:MAG: hypothetical protein V4496_05195 [Pseudomonadota bacterium]
MPSKISLLPVRQSLAAVYNSINAESSSESPFSLLTFLKLAIDIASQTLVLYKSTQEFLLSLEGITVSYDHQNGRYNIISIAPLRVAKKTFTDYNHHDIYEITSLLDSLFEITNIKNENIIGQLINIVLTNELVCFCTNRFHYENKNTKESLEILIHTLSTMKKLIDFPPSALHSLNTDAMRHLKQETKTFKLFIQNNYRHQNFYVELIEFINGMFELNSLEDYSIEDDVYEKTKNSSISPSASTATLTLSASSSRSPTPQVFTEDDTITKMTFKNWFGSMFSRANTTDHAPFFKFEPK